METIKEFLIAKESWSFLTEVVLRCVIAFIVVVIALKLTGKRGIRQLTLFELVIILTLGSAAGDVGFYKEVGVLTVVVSIATITCMYRLITYLVLKSAWFERLVEGEPATIIENGRFTEVVIQNQNISFDEFFMELRLQGIEHLGQVRLAILEVNGDVSVYKNEGKEIKPGLIILPEKFKDSYRILPEKGLYACVHCGYTRAFEKGEQPGCRSCGRTRWGKASARYCSGNEGCP